MDCVKYETSKYQEMNWLRDWVSSNSVVEQKTAVLKGKMCKLIAQESDIYAKLQHAELPLGKKLRKDVCYWLTAVQEIKDEVQSIIKDSEGLVSCPNSHLNSCIDRVIETVDQLIQQGKFSYGSVASVHNDHASKALPSLLGVNPVGKIFQHNCKEILGWLKNSDQDVFGVYGMGGVGKTTLLMHVHNLLLQNSDFSGRVYWVAVTKNCALKKIQKKIANAHGVGFSVEEDVRKRAAILHDKLTSIGSLVLFLDDLWEPFLKNEVGIPLKGSSCKIILSTRSLEVCRKMGCKSVINAGLLPKNDALDMFSEKLGHYGTLTEESKKIAKSISEECGGWPLVIATVARSMSGIVDIHDWKNALNKLKTVRKQVDVKNDVCRILQYSYDSLNDQIVQNCFLCCVLFPEDKKVARTALLDLWINAGLFDEIESREEQVARGCGILDRLENLCLLESTFTRDKKKCVKMHNLIRDMAIMVTKKYPYIIAESGRKLQYVPVIRRSKDVLKISLSYNNIEELPLPLRLYSPKLTVLMLSHNPLKNISESFFEHMGALRYLDLSFTLIEKLPDGITNLENLRALLLKGCKHLSYLPSVTKLSNLRVICLPFVEKCEEISWALDKFKCLLKPNCCWKVSNISSFNILTEAWQCKLCCFGIWFHGSLATKLKFDHHFNNYDKKGVMQQIVSGQEDHLDFDPYDGFDDYDKKIVISGVELVQKLALFIPQTIEMLRIYECEIKASSLGDIFPSLGNASELKMLVIESSKLLEYISCITQQGSSLFPLLECLDLNGLADLKGLIKLGNCHETLHPQSVFFSNLKQLHIWGCSKMQVVFPHKMLSQQQPLLPHLKMVRIIDCEELEEIFETDDVNITKPKPILSLCSLRVFSLSGLPKLSRIYRGLIICTLLESLTVSFCPKLEILPLSGPLICDSSASTLASLAYGDSDWWQHLFQDYPGDAYALRSRISKV